MEHSEASQRLLLSDCMDSIITIQKLGIDEQFTLIGYDNLFSHKTSSDS